MKADKYSIFDNMAEGVQVIGYDWRYLYVNEVVAIQGKSTRQELIGRTMPDKYPGIEATALYKVIENCMTSRTPQQMLNEFTFPDNTIGHFELKMVPIDEGVLIMSHDITELKRTETKSQKEKELADSIVNSLPGIFYLYDTTGKFLRWNKNFETVSGYNGDEVSKMHPLDFFDVDEKAMLEERIAKVFREGAADAEAHFLTKDRRKIPYYFNGHTVEYEGKTCLMGMGLDITERKSATAALIQAENRYRSIFENAIDGIYQTTPSGQFKTANDAMAKLVGYDSPEELIQSITNIPSQLYFDETDRQKILKEAERNGHLNGFEVRLKKKSGEPIWIHANLLAVKNDSGEIVHYQGAMRDITDRITTEKLLQVQFRELKKVNSELDQFVYSVSHDLRAPLASVLGLLALAERENRSETLAQYLNLIGKSINRLDGFIKDILDYSLNARMEMAPSKINFPELIEDVRANMAHLREYNRLRVNLDIHDSVPFYSDNTRLEIILNNLLSNAIKYQDFNKAESILNVRVFTTPDHARIVVSDNGIGIQDRHRDKVFNMFYRASENSKGSGLGLYIVHETIAKLGGTIRLKSEFGRQTTFEIEIPNRAA